MADWGDTQNVTVSIQYICKHGVTCEQQERYQLEVHLVLKLITDLQKQTKTGS